MNYKEVRKALDEAETSRNKTAMFHYLTLRYAEDFMDEDPIAFCKAVGMNESYSAEFSKMRALYSLMKNRNLTI